jgi:hypothetical protein
MAHKIGEDTEIQVSLKTLIGILIAVISVAAFIFHLEERLDILEMKTNTNYSLNLIKNSQVVVIQMLKY